MFTGLVQHIGEITAIQDTDDGRHLVIDSSGWDHVPGVGDSIAINGCCLTVTQSVDGSGQLHFDLTQQTAAFTTFGGAIAGGLVNLEAAVRAGDHLGGHLVQGHVDGVGEVVNITEHPARYAIEIKLADQWSDLCRSALVPFGSITIDGVSLTLTSVHEDGCEVVLIPITRKVTTLGQLNVGQSVNVEIDSVAKTVAQVVKNMKLS